jgi:hypothetical protein
VVHLSPITLTMRSEFGQLVPGGSDDSISTLIGNRHRWFGAVSPK